ncbi:MAG: hypothetical protein ABI267_10090 [Ginsengibacter sp.]
MNFKIITAFFVGISVSLSAIGQDTSQNQKLSENQTYHVTTSHSNYKNSPQHHIYRDTRLGGSSRLYNTYKKNDYGAGAITTNPHKTGSAVTYYKNNFNSSQKQSPVYRDTRLGGSSRGHRTYKKNDYGAGAITTNPNK